LPFPKLTVKTADGKDIPTAIFSKVATELGSIRFVKWIALGLGFPTEAPLPEVQLEAAVTSHDRPWPLAR